MDRWRKVKKVLLAQPPSGLYRRDDRCQSRVSDQTIQVIFPPLDLAYAAAVLEREGVECRIIDAPAEGISWREFKSRVSDFAPEVALIAVTQATFQQDRAAARALRDVSASILIGGRGVILSHSGREILQETREFDFLLRGESDETLAEIVRNGSPEGVPGVTYREGDRIVATPDRGFVSDPDRLPFPARRLLKNDLYRSPETGRPITAVQTARGCPARCVFCSVGATAGYKIRRRSPANVVDEVRECVERFGIRDFLFHADTFTWEKEWVIDLCRLLVQADLSIHWGCNSRVDTLDAERLEWMKKAGCWVVGFGVESGSDETLARIKKGTRRDQAIEAFRLCREAGIRSHAFFVFGFPWETEEDIKDTVRFAESLNPDFFDFNILHPLPGTEIYDLLSAENLLDDAKLDQGGYSSAAVRTRTVTAERLEQLRRRALWGLYLRPRYIFRTLRNAGSVSGVYHYGKAALKRAAALLQR
jgi:radical SAM superfamily enzyme YgiQ (UPF0313 family)